MQCSCGCGASWVSPMLIEKLQHVRDVFGKPMTITSGVRCESFNASIKGSLASSHMPDADGMGLAVDIAAQLLKHVMKWLMLQLNFSGALE